MTLSQKIAGALANAQPPETFVLDDGRFLLALDTRATSPIGAEVNSLEFGPVGDVDRSLSIDELKAWADRIVARVTYLMEPLVLVEADAEGVEVELRSKRPTPRDGHRSYYEVRLSRQGRARLVRFAFDDATRQRGQVPFQLTREVLERLADDFCASWDRPYSS
jgi:hypothetical protein